MNWKELYRSADWLFLRRMTTIRDLGWWYWFVTVGLLGAGLLGWRAGVYLAILLCVVQIAHVMRLTRAVESFPVQVRIAYLGLLVAGLWAPLEWIHWLPLIGTSARVVIGYCFLARVLSLASWNRTQPLSLNLVSRTFFSHQTHRPSCGDVFQRSWLEQVHG